MRSSTSLDFGFQLNLRALGGFCSLLCARLGCLARRAIDLATFAGRGLDPRLRFGCLAGTRFRLFTRLALDFGALAGLRFDSDLRLGSLTRFGLGFFAGAALDVGALARLGFDPHLRFGGFAGARFGTLASLDLRLNLRLGFLAGAGGFFRARLGFDLQLAARFRFRFRAGLRLGEHPRHRLQFRFELGPSLGFCARARKGLGLGPRAGARALLRLGFGPRASIGFGPRARLGFRARFDLGLVALLDLHGGAHAGFGLGACLAFRSEPGFGLCALARQPGCAHLGFGFRAGTRLGLCLRLGGQLGTRFHRGAGDGLVLFPPLRFGARLGLGLGAGACFGDLVEAAQRFRRREVEVCEVGADCGPRHLTQAHRRLRDPQRFSELRRRGRGRGVLSFRGGCDRRRSHGEDLDEAVRGELLEGLRHLLEGQRVVLLQHFGDGRFAVDQTEDVFEIPRQADGTVLDFEHAFGGLGIDGLLTHASCLRRWEELWAGHGQPHVDTLL